MPLRIAKSEKIASNGRFYSLKIEQNFKKNLHCWAVRTEIRTVNFFILSLLRRAWAIGTGLFLAFCCTKGKEEFKGILICMYVYV